MPFPSPCVQTDTLPPPAVAAEAEEIARRVKGIAAGCAENAAWLYDTCAPRLYRRLRHRYGYPGGIEVEDLCHDTFVVVFRHQARLLTTFVERTPRSELTLAALERYLWDQACGLASNRRRASGGRKLVAIDEVAEPREPADEEQRAVHGDVLARMVACLKGKGQRTYLYFLLRHHEGLAPEEVAKATGWSMKATYKLKQALNKAVQECAERLGLAVG